LRFTESSHSALRKNEHDSIKLNHFILQGKPGSFLGAVENSRQWRSPQFSVLTYWKYAPRAKLAAAFPSTSLRTGLDEPFDKAQGMLF